MSPGLRLWLLLLLIAGCAHQMLVVPDADWQQVPAPQRAAIDRQHEAAMVAARAELKAAAAGLAEAERTQGAAAPAAVPAGASRPDPDADVWEIAVYDHGRSRIAAHARVDQARSEWQRARLVWRQRQVDTASARIDVLVCDRELSRARAIDRTLLGSDHYDSAPLQGQFSRAQRQWHAAATGAREARAAFERASTTLASAKEAYAQVMRNGPARLATLLPSDSDERPRLELTGWAITRGDIGRRRGLRHLLDVAASAPPQLRKREFRLRPVPRTPRSETPRAAAPDGTRAENPETPGVDRLHPRAPDTPHAPGNTPKADTSPRAQLGDFVDSSLVASAAGTPRGKRDPQASARPKPWDFVGPTTARSATAPAKPWDFVEPAPRATTVIAVKRATAPRAAEPLPARSWDFVEPTPRPRAARTAAAARTSTSVKSAAPAPAPAASARPVELLSPAPVSGQ